MIILGARAITYTGTAAFALISFAALWRFKVSEPVLVLAAGLIGLILWPWCAQLKRRVAAAFTELLLFAEMKNTLALCSRSSRQNLIVIPGKLAVAGATRNPGFSKASECRFSTA